MDIVDATSPVLYAALNALSSSALPGVPSSFALPRPQPSPLPHAPSRISIGTRSGFLVFSVDPLQRLYQSEHGGCAIVAVLDNTPLVYCAGSGEHPSSDARVVQVFNMDHPGQCKVMRRVPFSTPVLDIKVNRTRCVVVLEHELHVFHAHTMERLATIDIPPNIRGLADLTVATEQSPQSLVYAVLRPDGDEVVLYDPLSLTPSRKLERLHSHPLTLLRFSPDAKYVATASAAGTIIRVLPVSERVRDRYSFRRGMMQSAAISSMAFNANATMLAVSSLNGTVHVFHLKEGLERPSSAKASYSSKLSGLVFGEEARSFATAKLASGQKSIVAFSEDSTRLYALTQDGKFSVWKIDKGGSTSALNSIWASVSSATLTSAPTCKLLSEENLLKDYFWEDGDVFTRTSMASSLHEGYMHAH